MGTSGLSRAMTFIDYDFEDKLDWKRLAPPLAASTAAVARLDERLRTLPFGAGVLERLAYFEASATILLEGDLVPVEDLVLLEAGCPQKPTYRELSICLDIYLALRHAGWTAPGPLLSSPRPGLAADKTLDATKLCGEFFDPNWDVAGRMQAFRAAFREAAPLPPMLAAALTFDAWGVLEPEQMGGWRQWLLGALVLREKRVFQGMLPLDWGCRKLKYRWGAKLPLHDRLLGFMDCAMAAAERANGEIDRLLLAEQVMARKLEGRRRNSHLPDLAALLLKKPCLSLHSAAAALKVGHEGARKMMSALGVREMTGRASFQLFRV